MNDQQLLIDRVPMLALRGQLANVPAQQREAWAKSIRDCQSIDGLFSCGSAGAGTPTENARCLQTLRLLDARPKQPVPLQHIAPDGLVALVLNPEVAPATMKAAGALAFANWYWWPSPQSAGLIRELLDWFESRQSPRDGRIVKWRSRQPAQDIDALTALCIQLSAAVGRGIKHTTRLIDATLTALGKTGKRIGDSSQEEHLVPLVEILSTLRHVSDYHQAEIQTALHALPPNTDLSQQNERRLPEDQITNLALEKLAENSPGSISTWPPFLPGHVAFQPLDPHLEFHFERVHPAEPKVPAYVLLSQQRRYGFAGTTLKQEQRVLDVGCGEGYGTRLLREMCDVVVGTDIDPRAIDRAAENYSLPGLTYMCSENLLDTFGKESFPAVTFFEVLEHVDRETAKSILKQISQVLTEQGRLIGTTPTVRGRSGVSSPRNPYHVYEYAAPEIVELLLQFFPQVRLRSIGTRGSLAFEAAKTPPASPNANGFDQGAVAFAADAQQFLAEQDPVWALETAIRALLLRPTTWRAGLIAIRSGLKIVFDSDQRRRFLSALWWRSDYRRDRIHIKND